MCVQAGQWCPVPTGPPAPTTSNPNALGCTEPGLGQGMAEVLGVPGGSAGCWRVLTTSRAPQRPPALPSQGSSSAPASLCAV